MSRLEGVAGGKVAVNILLTKLPSSQFLYISLTVVLHTPQLPSHSMLKMSWQELPDKLGPSK